MKKSIVILFFSTFIIGLVSFNKIDNNLHGKKGGYYFAAGQNTSLNKTYRATSNVFSLDCERVDMSSIGRQFSDFYKSQYSQSSSDFITGACYGPYDSYEEAEKKRNAKISDQKYLCNAPNCTVILAQGFRPACK